MGRFSDCHTDYYLIKIENQSIGYIRVVRLNADTCLLSQIAILPEYRSKGFAEPAIVYAEQLYPYAKHWKTDTIKQEQKLCGMYEKMGYRQTGISEHIKEGMDIIFYEKKK